jgi:protein gp37
MSDLFHPDVTDEFIAEVFAVMALADRHTFQVLTKRPQRMASLLSSSAFVDLVTKTVRGRDSSFEGKLLWPLRNVWLGTSIESNRYIWRADHLRKTPAAVRFLSCEPLLGPLPDLDLTGIDWVIVGGESGPKARPMHPNWVRGLRDRCVEAGVAFLFKQWGEWAPGRGSYSGSALTGNLRVTTPWIYLDHEGATRSTNELHTFRIPEGWAEMARVGKRHAGRELDEHVWDQYP